MLRTRGTRAPRRACGVSGTTPPPSLRCTAPRRRRRHCDRAPASSSPVRMRMRVLARVGEVMVASDGVASSSRGFLAIDFLMAPCRRVPWRRVFVVASLSRRDHHESDIFVVARFLGGRGGSERPPRVRPLDRPTDYLTDRRCTRAPLSNGDQPSPRGGCCGRLRRPRRPSPVHAHLDELVVRCERRRAAAAVVARGNRARTCAQAALSSRPFTDVESIIIIVTW